MKSLIAMTLLAVSPLAFAPASFAQTQTDLNPYYTWCDQVETILNDATRIASVLYGQTRFTQAKQIMVDAFQRALNSAQLPGSFRPNTQRELSRTLELVSLLEGTPVANPTLKDKMIAYVALNRVKVVHFVKNSLDHPYVIPCYGRRCDGYGSPVNMGGFEAALASVARLQLETAQNYSSQVVSSGRIRVYPLVDASTYFTIISKAAEWAAQDLSMALFGSTFSCAILELQNLGSEAASMQAMAGDVYAVQYIHDKVNVLKSALNQSPYGCGGIDYPQYPYGQ